MTMNPLIAFQDRFSAIADDPHALYIPPDQAPPELLREIKEHPSLDGESFTGPREIEGRIVKARRLTIQAGSTTRFKLYQTNDIRIRAIAALDIFLEAPTGGGRPATVGWQFDPPLDGADSPPGRPGWQSPDEDGTHGQAGESGQTGQAGKQVFFPPLMIICQRLHLVGASPITGGALYLDLHGLRGGNGGRGGDGGNGGRGATGTAGHVSYNWLGIPTCAAGPGMGGNGGPAGSGGRGGDAGGGGHGGNIHFVMPRAPLDNWAFVNSHFIVQQSEGPPGLPGMPGRAGAPGEPGGGGRFQNPCGGRGPGQRGANANPPHFGEGNPGPNGHRGLQFFQDRDVSDLF